MAYNSRPRNAADPQLNERAAFAIPIVEEVHSSKASACGGRYRWLPVLLWVIFGTGLLVQMFGPSLQIKNNTFVIPQSLISGGKDIHPDEIVADERSKQVLSAILTVGGALAMAFYYRTALVSSLRSLSPSRQRGTVFLPLKSDSRTEHRKTNRKQQNETL
jgi:hypothetical protein